MIQCATARIAGIAYFFKKSSRFEKYKNEVYKKKGSEKPVLYSTAKNHYDALIRKYYREHRKTDKITPREQVMILVEEKVQEHLKACHLYYDLEYISKPITRKKHSDSIKLNMIQRAMYRRVMYGLSEYTPEQIADLTSRFEQKIAKDHRKARLVVQTMKARRLYKMENDLIHAMFQHVTIPDDIYFWNISVPKKYTLRSMGISTLEVIDEFITNKLLPKNFLSMDVTQVEL